MVLCLTQGADGAMDPQCHMKVKGGEQSVYMSKEEQSSGHYHMYKE